MGEMIKFGIKLALTIATAIALVAAIALLFNLISSITISTSGYSFYTIREISYLISIALPINFSFILTCITTLFSFKVAYWAADKMIQFISASS